MLNTTDQYRREAIINSLRSYEESGEKRSLNIEYRGQDKVLPVIRIDPKLLLLNHDNSRLSAQLQDHPQREIVVNNPTSSDAQSVLASLLSKTERFKKLKEELRDLTQQNPGLITRDGLLINGNTRVVALRELGADGVDVAVLPDDALAADFLDLEMSLQMRRLTHQDYTFTNELLLMKKYKDFNHNEKQLATKMGWFRGWQKKINNSFQLLSLVEEIRTLTVPPLAYEIFDSKSQHLIDLNNEYQAIATTDIREANQMKWGRVCAMFLGVNKDQTRVIDNDFFDEDVMQRIDTNPEVVDLLSNFKKIPVEDDLGGLLEDNDSEQIDLRSFAKKIVSDLTDADGEVAKDLTPELQNVHKAIRMAAEATITKGKREKYLAEPSDILMDTRISLEGVVDMFHEVCTFKGFDSKKFEFHLNKVHKSLDDLSKEFKKYQETK